MTSVPKVIIGGYPRSGTSFLCRLIAEMGYWPGSYYNLKMPNDNNKLGYWEHLPLREITWEASGFRKDIIYCKPDTLPCSPLDFEDHEAIERFYDLAEEDNVEVYKDNALPLIYKFFSRTNKFIIILRNWQDVHQSVLRMERGNFDFLEVIDSGSFWGISPESIERAVQIYRELTQCMIKDTSCMIVNYKDFENDGDYWIECIADYLGIQRKSLNMERLRKIYCPDGGREA